MKSMKKVRSRMLPDLDGEIRKCRNILETTELLRTRTESLVGFTLRLAEGKRGGDVPRRNDVLRALSRLQERLRSLGLTFSSDLLIEKPEILLSDSIGGWGHLPFFFNRTAGEAIAICISEISRQRAGERPDRFSVEQDHKRPDTFSVGMPGRCNMEEFY